VEPLLGFALDHPEQAPVYHWQRGGFEGDQQEDEPIVRGAQGAGLVHGTSPGGPGFPIQPPLRHMGLKSGFKGGDQVLKLVERHARQIEELCRAVLQVGEP